MKLLELTREEHLLVTRLSTFGDTFSQIVAYHVAGLPQLKHRKVDRGGTTISANWNFVPNKYGIASKILQIQKTLVAKTKKQVVLIDYGAGLGNIMSLASALYCMPYGIEYEPKYIKALVRCFGDSAVIEGTLRDKRTIKKMLNLYQSHYNANSPVIHYMYRPLNDEKGLKKLIKDIISCANRKVDNYFLLQMVDIQHLNLPLERVADNIYILKQE